MLELMDREVTNYNSMHRKVTRLRGRAADYLCVDCKERDARHWSLGADAEVILQVGTKWEGRLFSTDVDAYEPRCVPCHAKHDTENGLLRNPNGVRNSWPTRGKCTRDGCDKPHKAKGLCDTHYRQVVRQIERDKRRTNNE
jgi:hypothetical protein